MTGEEHLFFRPSMHGSTLPAFPGLGTLALLDLAGQRLGTGFWNTPTG